VIGWRKSEGDAVDTGGGNEGGGGERTISLNSERDGVCTDRYNDVGERTNASETAN